MASGLSTHADLADALAAMARDQAAADPNARGSDWRLAVVATVDADGGTVTTTDSIIARRMDTYRYPAAGDVIVISVSGTGNWLAAGRLAPSTGNGWQAAPLESPWVNYSNGYQVARYRRDGCDVVMEGLVKTTSSVSGNVTIFTLPSGFRPSGSLVFPSVGSAGSPQQFNVYSTGGVSGMSLDSGFGYLTLNCRFSTI